MFDVRVTNMECATQRRRDPKKVLASYEKLTEKKYLEPCLAPLVFSVDGLRGTETEAACKRLVSLLSKKWKRDYSEVCRFVRSRRSLALVRSASFCLRGARGDPKPNPYICQTGGRCRHGLVPLNALSIPILLLSPSIPQADIIRFVNATPIFSASGLLGIHFFCH